MELKELFELVQENAERLFLLDGSISPLWHAVPANGEHMLIATPWSNDMEKEVCMYALRDLFDEHRIVRFAFVCEGWKVQVREKDAASALRTRPSKHPDRREVLLINCEDRNGGRLSGHFYILRPEHGPPTLSPFHQDPPSEMMMGRLADLFTSKTRH